MKKQKRPPQRPPAPRWLAAGLIALVLAILFWRSFLPDYVFFSNDGPLGVQNAAWLRLPAALTGMWPDLNYLGNSGGAATPSITVLLRFLLSPLGFAKFYALIALFILGIGAWTFFQQLRLTPLACALGALAMVLNSSFFSGACWGVASQEIAVGMDCLALALIAGSAAAASRRERWVRWALAGLCVGMNVIEAADIGVLFSLLVALFVFVHALVTADGAPLQRTLRGVGRVTVVAGFAGFIGFQSVLSLLGIAVQGMTGMGQDTQTKAGQWDWATQWSLPKAETLALIVPGLFGYKMDTPNNMQPSLRDAYASGAYWGGVGRAPVLDRYFDGGCQGQQPSAPGLYMRQTGGGNYSGILVLLVAGWMVAQSLRRQNPLVPREQKRMVQFWAAVLLLCLLFAWGRFAPFYSLLYQLPYASVFRNPTKFLLVFGLALVVIFAYGVHVLNLRYLDEAAGKGAGFGSQMKSWWAKAGSFDRNWTYIAVGLVAASVVGWLIFQEQKPALIAYLHMVGFGSDDPAVDSSAAAIAAFSLGQAAWFLVLFAVAVGLVLLVITGYFNGPRARTGAVLLGGFMLFDLCRADLPWLTDWDYKQKCEVGSLNPIVKHLLEKPYEHRVAYALPQPLATPDPWQLFDKLYLIEWMQHIFPYYNIQSLDIVQMPRLPEDYLHYEQMFAIKARPAAAGGFECDPATFPSAARKWELTNTRYLLGPAPLFDTLNQQFDPERHRFRVVERFDVLPKPGISNPYGITQKEFAHYLPLEQVTAVSNPDGDYALFEFTGALPRAGVYSNWQVKTNDQAVLEALGDLRFDPAKTVLVSTPEDKLPAAATNEDPGTVAYQFYEPAHIVLSAQTAGPSVLLLNDRYDPQWRVTVDGQPAELLRCNFMMRGVYLPKGGPHKVDFRFEAPHRPLYVTIAALALGLGLCSCLFYFSRRRPAPVAQGNRAPGSAPRLPQP